MRVQIPLLDTPIEYLDIVGYGHVSFAENIKFFAQNRLTSRYLTSKVIVDGKAIMPLCKLLLASIQPNPMICSHGGGAVGFSSTKRRKSLYKEIFQLTPLP